MARLFIGGESVESESGEYFQIRNPATGEVVDSVSKGTRGDVRKAVDSSKEALEDWSSTAPAERGKTLLRVAELLRGHEDELAALLTREQGKPINEARGEIRFSARLLEFYADAGLRLTGIHVPLYEKRKYAVVMKVPIGVCGAITPWNFPVSLMYGKVAPALASGNTILVKPASTTPLTAIRSAELAYKAGVPKGVFNIVAGPGGTVGQEILEHPEIRRIAFTGETRTGKRIMETAAQQVKRVTLELGGSDPMIVCDDADLERAVEAATNGRFRNCGQVCNAVKRLYLFESIADQFINRLVEGVRRIKVGNGLNLDTVMGPMNNEDQRVEVEEMVREAASRGAKILIGGKRPAGVELDKGYFYLPTLLADVDYESKIAKEECFGPALPIFIVKNLEEAIERGNDSIYGLGSSIWTKDMETANVAARKLLAGTIWVNCHQGAEIEVPFGGFKLSGLGREFGEEGIEHYLEIKSVHYAI